ncbi:MAG: protocatechuate 4,5-dioxygenase subunit beta [Actinomycetia bacterium]|nr:protocatechuate 4,5-dioxygenase subunit beta [Actinomycetes bacterium]
MASVVGGFLAPHDPLMFSTPDAAPAGQRDAVSAAYAELGARLGRLDPTAVVVIGADHYVLFGPGCLPQYLLGIGDVDGPLERLPGLERGPMPTNPRLAEHIMGHGREHGFDWAVAKSITVDHSIGIPYALMVKPNGAIPVIPVYLAAGVEPLVPLSRAAALGRSIREAVESFPGDERVVVIGSGGISHWVGLADMGRVNEDFDREVIAHVEAGDIDALCAYGDADIVERGGNGALELRNFVCAMSAVPAVRGELVEYQAVPAWITGLGFLELVADGAAVAR